jgi:hypothetical protein
MGGGLMQLVAYGAQDIYLTGNPQITFFKIVYRRHTNFSIESIEQTLTGSVNFGKKSTCTISRNGDLIQKMIFQVTLPALNQSQGGATWQGYVNSIGHAILKSVTVNIGGQQIDKHYSEWLEIWNELTIHEEHRNGFNENIGKFESDVSLETNATSTKTYYVPLQFWFCRNPGLALPLIALQYHEVTIDLDIRPLKELVRSDISLTAPQDSDGNLAVITDASLWIDYIYLDTDERRRFAQVSHEYLIEQVQTNGASAESIDTANTTHKINLDLNHPVKELVWAINMDDNSQISTSAGNQIFNFSSTSGSETFNTAKISFNGYDRMKERKAAYFRTVQPLHHHTRVPTKYIYSYSFGLKPEDHQPSGTCNFSRIDTAQLHLDTTGVTSATGRLRVYGVNYNVLRVMSGMAGVAYSN